MPAQKNLSYYLALRYSYELIPCAGGGYLARHPDLEGCATQAETVEEAMTSLQEARELWLESQISDNAYIPEPLNEEPSGRLMLRIPLRLHAELGGRAVRLSVSLNRLLNEVLFNHANRLPLEHGLERLATSGREDIEGSREGLALEHYLSLRYPYQLLPTEEGGYLAEYPDLPGCSTQGASAAKAVTELDGARELWIASRLEDGLPVPEPLPLEHTGIVSLRLPPALHYQLARAATRNGVSLNQWLVMALSEFAGEIKTRERLSQETFKSLADAESANVHQVVSLFRQGLDRSALGLLGNFRKDRADFLAGILYLERNSFKEAFQNFSAAYSSGLSFTTDAIKIYHQMPDKLSHRNLLDLMLQLSHVILADTSERRDVHLLLAAWLDCIRDKALSQQQWRRWGRDKRDNTLARVLEFNRSVARPDRSSNTRIAGA